MNLVEIAPIIGERLLFSPGRVGIRFDEGHRRAYRRPTVCCSRWRAFQRSRTTTSTDALKLTRRQLAVLNRAFAGLGRAVASGMRGAFEETGRPGCLPCTTKPSAPSGSTSYYLPREDTVEMDERSAQRGKGAAWAR